jgi:hypothetical protein
MFETGKGGRRKKEREGGAEREREGGREGGREGRRERKGQTGRSCYARA